tara:strand:- start:1014 stop:1862 length:849 start_codon:yes stop_codon:yes gene_type:complete
MHSEIGTIIISGAHSSIGQLLIQNLKNRSVNIIGIITPWGNTDKLIKKDTFIEYICCDLNRPLSDNLKIKFKNSTIFIHLAWARPKISFEALKINENMFFNVLASLPKEIKIIYISSVVSNKYSISNYGKAKYNLSQILKDYNTVEVIIGLVVSKPAKGPYKLFRDFLNSSFLTFSFRPSPICFLSSTEQIINGIINSIYYFEKNKPVIKAFDLESITLNKLINDIKSERNSFVFSIPIPTNIVIKLLLLLRNLFFRVAIFDKLITLLTISNRFFHDKEKIK